MLSSKNKRCLLTFV